MHKRTAAIFGTKVGCFSNFTFKQIDSQTIVLTQNNPLIKVDLILMIVTQISLKKGWYVYLSWFLFSWVCVHLHPMIYMTIHKICDFSRYACNYAISTLIYNLTYMYLYYLKNNIPILYKYWLIMINCINWFSSRFFYL